MLLRCFPARYQLLHKVNLCYGEYQDRGKVSSGALEMSIRESSVNNYMYVFWHLYCNYIYLVKEACGIVDWVRTQDQKLWEFDFHCWSWVEVSGRLLINTVCCLPSSDGYMVDKNCVFKWRKLHAYMYLYVTCTCMHMYTCTCMCCIPIREMRLLMVCAL